MNNKIRQTIEILNRGGVVIFPTDTAYGIGCRIDDPKAVERLLTIKGRPKNKAMPILASDITMVKQYVDIVDNNVKKLMDRYWPGGLTIVLPTYTGNIVPDIRGGGDTIGVRVPSHVVIREVIRGLGVPIVGSSANPSGGKTPFHKSTLDPRIVKQVDMVLEGVCGGSLPSTVLDCTRRPWKILREGAVRLNLKEYA